MRCNMLQAGSPAASLDYVPHNILRDAFAPHLSRPGDGSKDPSLRDPGCRRPMIERRFYPFGDGHGADVAVPYPEHDALASFSVNGPLETWPVASREFRDVLQYRYYRDTAHRHPDKHSKRWLRFSLAVQGMTGRSCPFSYVSRNTTERPIWT